MRYFKFLARFSAPTAPTAPTFGRNTVGTLFPQGRNTGRNTFQWYAVLFSRLKNLFFRGVGRNSRNTFPNFAQEKSNLSEGIENPPVDERFPDSCELGDEFDHEDFDEWWEDNCEEWWDGSVYNQRGKCWEQEAVDEIIDEENNMGDIPF